MYHEAHQKTNTWTVLDRGPWNGDVRPEHVPIPGYQQSMSTRGMMGFMYYHPNMLGWLDNDINYLLIYGGIHDLLTGNLWSPYYTQLTPLDCRCSNGIFAYPGLVLRWRNFPPVAVKHWPWRMSASRGKHAWRKPSLYQSQIAFTVFISTFMTLETCNFQPSLSLVPDPRTNSWMRSS